MTVDEGDIAWAGPAGSFKYRTAAVIRDDDRLLVCAVEHIDGWEFANGTETRNGDRLPRR